MQYLLFSQMKLHILLGTKLLFNKSSAKLLIIIAVPIETFIKFFLFS